MAFKSMRDRHPDPVAATLIDLWAEWDDDPDFAPNRASGARLVPGFGTYGPLAMVVGDYPGAVDTAQERPFSGADGTVLRDLMGTAGLYTEDTEIDGGRDGDVPVHANAWLTYTFKYRVSHKPTVWHSLKAQPYLRREWAIIGQPRVIVAVGALAWETLGRVELGGILQNAGQPIALRGNNFIWPMLHPAYGLAHEDQQPRMERHWEHLGEWLDER